MNLRELAESLGLSQTTVSRALNGYPEVREETRARVLAAARAANYTPNTRARRLATGRAMTIGHVIPLAGKTEMVNPIFSDFLAGAGEVYAREGYDMLLSVVAPAAPGRLSPDGGERVGRRRDGPGAADRRPARAAVCRNWACPSSCMGAPVGHADYSWLDVANTSAFRRATDFLLDFGPSPHRADQRPGKLRLRRPPPRRLRGGADRARHPDRPRADAADVMTEAYGYAAAAEMLDAPDPPTAFVVSSIIPAIGVRRAAGERGLRLGRDLSLICHDDVLSYLSNDAEGPPSPPRDPRSAPRARAAPRS
jgi:LacI family transcriptional regulator